VRRPPASPRRLACRELVELLADYLAGDLGSDERGRIEGHLADCLECLAYFRSYRITVRTVREACQGEDEMLSLLPATLVRAIVAARRERGG
jgi:predicted anti-sigma-YlaC factor YlaD